MTLYHPDMVLGDFNVPPNDISKSLTSQFLPRLNSRALLFTSLQLHIPDHWTFSSPQLNLETLSLDTPVFQLLRLQIFLQLTALAIFRTFPLSLKSCLPPLTSLPRSDLRCYHLNHHLTCITAPNLALSPFHYWNRKPHNHSDRGF